MSIGNLKDYGNKGNNFPWQLKMLQGQQCACDYLKEIDLNTDQIEPLLAQILTSIQGGSDYEAMLVVDNTGLTWLEIRLWNGTTFDPPIYYEAGQNVPGTPAFPITYINPNTYLAQIVSYTSNLVSIEAGTPDALGQTTMSASMPVTMASDQTPLPITDGGGSITVDGAVSITGEVEIINAVGSPIPVTIVAPVPVINVNLDAADDQVGVYGYINGVSTTPVPLNVNAQGQVAIQDGGNSITVDAISLPLPTGAATETTLLLVNNNLSSASRIPGIKTYVNAVGSTTAGIYSFSIANVGSASGLVDGEVLPAGVTVNFDGGAMNNTLTALTFDATGTTFVVTTIS